MAPPLFTIALSVTTGLLGARALAQTAITACSTPESLFSAAGATTQYAVCPSTSFFGNDSAMVPNVPSAVACAQLCDQTYGCVRAVHNAIINACHIKDASQQDVWIPAQGFSAIRFVNDTSTPEIIARCPVNPTDEPGPHGQAYGLCPGTGFRGADAGPAVSVPSAQGCMDLCRTTDGCQKAVYDALAATCTVKNTSQAVFWTADRRYATVHRGQSQDPSAVGQWSDIHRLPLIPVAVFVVPAFPAPTRMLAFSSYADEDFLGGPSRTQFASYTFADGTVTQRQVSNTQHDMFCPGMSQLGDGRLVVTGGDSADVVSIYDPVTDSWSRGADMRIPRGYQSQTTLSDNGLFDLGGSWSGGWGGKVGERYDPATNTWALLPGAAVEPILTNDTGGVFRQDNHAWLFAWTNGSVFQAGPSRRQHWYSTHGNGSITEAAERDDADAMCGCNVMFEAGRILSAGGAPEYEKVAATARAHLTSFGTDAAGQSGWSAVTRVADMAAPRVFGNTVVLPDGRVVVVGGQTFAKLFSDDYAVLAAELFDPATGAWTTMAEAAVARNYHAAAVLLPDGTVWSGGGGMCWPGGPCDESANHRDGQIFSPPYLFNADGSAAARPVVAALANTTVSPGGQIQVTMADAAPVTFSLIRIGSCTHSINTDQRRIVPTVTATTGAVYTLSVPADSGIMLPGYWYLFVVSRAGVPSMARTVQVTL